MRKIIVVCLLFGVSCLPISVFAGILDSSNKESLKPVILLGEVCGYVDFPIQPEYLDAFADLIKEQIQESKVFRLETPIEMQPFFLNGKFEDLKTVLSYIHMNSIARGKYYQREQVSAGLLRYTDELYGYKYNSDKKKAKIQNNKYSLSPYLSDALSRIRTEQNVNYLLFCNVKKVNTRRSTNAWWQKINVDVDYYLVDADKGTVYEANSFSDKTIQRMEVWPYVKYSKMFSINQMLHDVLEVQAKRIVKDVSVNGISRLR